VDGRKGEEVSRRKEGREMEMGTRERRRGRRGAHVFVFREEGRPPGSSLKL